MPGESLILGVDGGGTSTVAWLARGPDGFVVGKGEAGPSNAKAVGVEAARRALEEARARAFGAAGLEPRRVAVVCLGLAGFDRPEDRALLGEWVDDWSNRLVLVNDAELVIAAGTREGWGVAVIAGTGSICVGRARDGRVARAGGWGHLIGDEGSAYRVALEGLRLVAQRCDGREVPVADPDPLTVAACAAFEVDRAEAIISRIYDGTWDRTRLAGLAPLVAEAAESGDDAALDLIQNEGEALAQMVGAVCEKLGWLEVLDEPLPLALAGGFLVRTPALQEALIETVEEIGFRVVRSIVEEPVVGAVALARQALIA
ncbi:MAG: N-acetylglucosamine kinase [Isosphaeraceae bacterium]|jgi:N-acetylglucosamine kinase-like BadF-type ATPase|nr:MAG: N-acetylglucosamine kinase [Isosphaeraceae bacterium]